MLNMTGCYNHIIRFIVLLAFYFSYTHPVVFHAWFLVWHIYVHLARARRPLYAETQNAALGSVVHLQTKDHVTRGNFFCNLQRSNVSLQVAAKIASCSMA